MVITLVDDEEAELPMRVETLVGAGRVAVQYQRAGRSVWVLVDGEPARYYPAERATTPAPGSKPYRLRCPRCGVWRRSPNAGICRECWRKGERPSAPARVACPQCGQPMSPRAKVCRACYRKGASA